MRTVLRLAIPVVLTVAACWVVYHYHGNPKRGVDDAQILFSYSTNLAAGRGLTYGSNPEHVEGATSLLWTIICAVPFRLGFDESGVLAIAVILLCLTQILILDIIRRSALSGRHPTWPFEILYLYLVFSCPMYFTWMSITLMDTCLWGFLVVLMIYVALLSPRSSLGMLVGSVPFFLAPLSRPEAMLVAPAIIVLAALRGEAGRKRLPRLVLSLTAAFLVSLAAVTVFRLSYFGYPLPNTFYAKVSPSPAYDLLEGGSYLLRFVFTSGPIICASALFLLWCAVDMLGRFASYLRTRHRHIGISDWELAALASVVLLIVPVLEGGDHFRGYRFYKPVYPVMTASVVLFFLARGPAGIHRRLASFSLPKRSAVPFLFLLAGLAVWTLWSSHAPSWVSIRHGSPIRNEFRIAEDGIERGRRLKNLFSGISSLPSIGVIASGGISRTYPGRIVGLLGLNNPVIAHYPGDRKGRKSHAAFEKDVFFKLIKIDILLASPPVPPNTSNWHSFILKGLMFDPRFTREWRYGVLSSRAAPNSGVEAFYSIEFLKRIEAAAPYEFREKMVWTDKWVEVADAGHRPRSANVLGVLLDSADTVNSARAE